MVAPNTSSMFSVQCCTPELIAPPSPTPHEIKHVSDIDDQGGIRYHLEFAYLYASDPSKDGVDPVRVIREALARALVFYYPLAGRLREGPGRKLSVECTGEGVLFVEADADVELNHFGDQPVPPFPYIEKFLQYDEPLYCTNILDRPLFHFQVTRLKCKGFVVAFRYIHSIADGFGLNQFLSAVCEIARGSASPSILPVWSREIFSAREEPHVMFTHHEYEKNTGIIFPFENHDDIVERSFFFGSSEVSAILRLLPAEQSTQWTKFEVLTAYLWRCRLRALEMDPEEEVRLHFTMNARGKLNPPLPEGYYGNAFVFPTIVTTAGNICRNPLEYTVKLVRTTKPTCVNEYFQSAADLLVSRGRPSWSMTNSYFVSDITLLGLLDFGWGNHCFGGPPRTDLGLSTYYIKFKNKMGEFGRLVTVGMPALAMDKFTKELDQILRPQTQL